MATTGGDFNQAFEAIGNGAFRALILMGYAHCTLAAPPAVHMDLNPLQPGARSIGAVRLDPGARRLDPGAGRLDPGAGRLDLRLPDDARFAAARSDASESMARAGVNAAMDERLSDLHAAYANGVKAESLQSTVERYRHDGLPVARLWENKSALVSLGLNGRGKPGLWLVQKIH